MGSGYAALLVLLAAAVLAVQEGAEPGSVIQARQATAQAEKSVKQALNTQLSQKLPDKCKSRPNNRTHSVSLRTLPYAVKFYGKRRDTDCDFDDSSGRVPSCPDLDGNATDWITSLPSSVNGGGLYVTGIGVAKAGSKEDQETLRSRGYISPIYAGVDASMFSMGENIKALYLKGSLPGWKGSPLEWSRSHSWRRRWASQKADYLIAWETNRRLAQCDAHVRNTLEGRCVYRVMHHSRAIKQEGKDKCTYSVAAGSKTVEAFDKKKRHSVDFAFMKVAVCDTRPGKVKRCQVKKLVLACRKLKCMRDSHGLKYCNAGTRRRCVATKGYQHKDGSILFNETVLQGHRSDTFPNSNSEDRRRDNRYLRSCMCDECTYEACTAEDLSVAGSHA